LTSADFKDPKELDIIDENYYRMNLARTVRKMENEKDSTVRVKSYAEIFYDKYLDKRVNRYFFYPSVYSFILSGYLNQIDFENEIQKRNPEIISPEIQGFRTLLNYNFRELSDTDFKKLTRNVLQYAKEGKYWIYDYVQIANFFYFFSNNQLILESSEDIDKILFEGLNIVKCRKEINDGVLENLLHFTDENPQVTKMKQTIKEIHAEIKKEEYIATSNELIECLAKEDGSNLAEIFDKHKFSKELFQYVDDKLLLETILIISNKQLFNFTELLEKRYKIDRIGEFLFEDTICLTKLKVNFSEYLKESEDIQQPRKFLNLTLESTLNFAIQKLIDTQKK